MNEQVSKINPNAVTKDIFSEVEITAGYFFILTVANLIALCGLIMNSSPVIIGAMLVSPLMGPILSYGFAFVTGDNVIWNSSLKKISLSVVLSITVAAAATYLSPLKDVTGEILSRTRPNLYDLIIAFLAGTAGASALCTKKNFLTIVPGVAIATAVIPPLSVAGFGAGIANLKIFYGGFLLFFTNFVAIVLSTCAVFFFYGFKRRMAAEVELSQIKKRFAFLITVLIVISIPLIYTLHTSIAEVRQRTAIRDALQHALEKEKRSHLVTFTYTVDSDGNLKVNALVNTVSYLNDEEMKKAESYLGRTLGKMIVLNVEQVKVQTLGIVGMGAFGLESAKRHTALILESIDFNQVLLHGMLSFLLFAGALHIRLDDLAGQKWVIILLSTAGVIVSTFIVGGLAWLLLDTLGIPAPFVYCLLFGALISPTDPVAVLGILKTAGVPKSLETKMAGESLFNDGIGVVVFVIILELVKGGSDVTAGRVLTLFMEEQNSSFRMPGRQWQVMWRG